MPDFDVLFIRNATVNFREKSTEVGLPGNVLSNILLDLLDHKYRFDFNFFLFFLYLLIVKWASNACFQCDFNQYCCAAERTTVIPP